MVKNPLVLPIRDCNDHPGPFGLSPRDYFAGQALAIIGGQFARGEAEFRGADEIAAAVYQIADAMLATRTKADK